MGPPMKALSPRSERIPFFHIWPPPAIYNIIIKCFFEKKGIREKKGTRSLLGLRAFIGGPIYGNWLGAVREHWRQPQKST